MSNFTDPTRLGISGKVLAACRAQGRAAFVGYLPVGYPDVAKSCEAYRVLCEGADMVEIGKTPVVMTYWNLIEQYGPDAFARDLAAAGGAGVITPDLTPDEADEWIAATDAHGLDRIFLIAPSSTPERIAMTMAACRGWVYATSVMGVTGVRRGTSLAAPVIAARAREIDPGLPVGVGMGVGNGDQAAEVGAYADAVIVGSALVRCLASDGADMPGDLEKLGALAAELLEGVRRSR